MDANEHILDEGLCRELTAPRNNLDLLEISHKVWRGEEPNTYIDGKMPIDGVWASPELEIGGFKILYFGESVGDHRTVVFDISTRSLIGKFEQKVVRSGCRRLNTKNEKCFSSYNKILLEHMRYHRMEDRLDKLIAEIGESNPNQGQRARMESLDRQRVELQKHAERKCRKILKPDLEFSGEVKLWHERMMAFNRLIKWRQGKVRNVSNLIRYAKRRGIENPKELSLEQLQAGVQYAKAQKRLRKGTASGLRREHLRECLLDAESKNQEDRARGIKATIQREKNAKMWYVINRSQKDPGGKSIHSVQKVVNGQVVDSTSKEETVQFIFGETEFRFQLATDAPINKTKLVKQLGYLADTEIAQQLIEGTYDIPDEVDDATTLILEEFGRIGMQMTNGDITVTISPETFQHFWRRVKERTSSSLSGIYYGHYKAAALNNELSSFVAKQITLIARTGVPPERWSYGLTVMLEKVAGIALVNKLRAILLMEADFNFHNKLVFGSRIKNASRRS